MKRNAFVLLALAGLATSARAQVDAETNQPYDMRVVIKCGAHNWLGKQFRDDLRNSLHGMLQNALGAMGKITVVDLKDTPADQWEPLWRDFDAKGFAVLDGPVDLTGMKDHFIRVDYVNGQYEIQARQVDGMTGMVSAWRRERTADRAFVPRVAGKMIGRDFGLIGTLVGKGEIVPMAFKAGEMGAPLDIWVHKGDVFAVYEALPKNSQGKVRAVRVPETVVQVQDEPKNGRCNVKVIHRSAKNPTLDAGSSSGFRCVKVPSVAAPMRLRLVDEKGQPHVRTLQIRVHPDGFQQAESRDEEVLNPDRGGLFVSKRTYDRIAYVRVVTGATQIAKLPTPILEDREVVVSVGVNVEREQAGQLQALKSELLRRFHDTVSVQNERYLAISKLVKETKNTQALARADAAKKALDEDLERLRAQLAAVKKDIGNVAISVADCEKLDKDLENYRDRLNRIIGQLREFEALANAPDKVERRQKLLDLNNKAQVALDSNDYDGALAIYRQIVMDFPEESNIKKKLDDLDSGWALKGDDHRAAREFIYRDWPLVKSAADIEAKLPTARQKMQVCIRVMDQFTLLKLRASLPEVGKILADEIRTLGESSDEMDKINKLKKLVEDFDKLGQEIDAALNVKAG